MSRKRVLLDVDGVLADFTVPFLAEVNKFADKTYFISDLKSCDFHDSFPEKIVDAALREISKPDWCYSLKPFPEALDGVKELKKVSDIFIVTSPLLSKTWAYERSQWLIDYFDIPHTNHVITKAKYLVAGDFLVDDTPRHVVSWAEANLNGTGLLKHQSYNVNYSLSSNRKRVYSWEEILKLVTK